MDANEFLERQLANLMEDRISVEKEEQQDFIINAKNQLNKENLNELKATEKLTNLMDKKITRTYSSSLNQIEKQSVVENNSKAMRSLVIKNVLITTFLMVNNKFKKAKEEAFR